MKNDLLSQVDEKTVTKNLANISKRIKNNVLLKDFTTFRLGGPAKLFIEVNNLNELIAAIYYAHEQNIKFKVLGVGANILVSDEGLDLLVIRNRAVKIIQDTTFTGTIIRKETELFHQTVKNTSGEIKYSTPANRLNSPLIVYSGTPLAQLVRKSIQLNLTGLEYFSGIPATVGGAIYNNVHGGSDLFCEFIESIIVCTPSGVIKQIPITDLQPRYDWTNLHQTNDTVLACRMLLSDHEPISETLMRAKQWLDWKLSIQPQIMTAGCVFKNISAEEQKSLGVPTMSVGYVIEHLLKAKDWQVGGAKISRQHANFIVNDGSAKSEDVLSLIKKIQKSAQDTLGLNLELEVEVW